MAFSLVKKTFLNLYLKCIDEDINANKNISVKCVTLGEIDPNTFTFDSSKISAISDALLLCLRSQVWEYIDNSNHLKLTHSYTWQVIAVKKVEGYKIMR